MEMVNDDDKKKRLTLKKLSEGGLEARQAMQTEPAFPCQGHRHRLEKFKTARGRCSGSAKGGKKEKRVSGPVSKKQSKPKKEEQKR